MMKNSNNSAPKISIIFLRSLSQIVVHVTMIYGNKINMLVKLSAIEFTMMKLLAILQFKTGKTIIKESCIAR